MTKEDLLLLACARQDFLPTHRKEVLRIAASTLRWQEIYSTARRHKVAPLVYANLLECGDALVLPPAIADQFEFQRSRNVRRKQEVTEKLAAVLACCNAYPVEAMLLKGAALDLVVYDRPWYTAADDADLVLRCRRGGADFEPIRERLQPFRGKRIEFDFYEHHDVTMNGVLRIDFERIWHDAVPTDFRGCRVLLMSAEDLLLSVCINSCRKRFFRLKSLCDIAECVMRLPELNWDIFARTVRESGCGNIVYTALLIAAWTLGCRISEDRLDSLGVHSTRRRLLRSLACALLRFGSLSFFACDSGDGRIDPSLLLPYASYSWSQAWRSLWWVLRQETSAIIAPRRCGP